MNIVFNFAHGETAQGVVKAAETAAAPHAEKASGIAALGLNLKTFIFQMVAFLIVVIILNKYALPKIFAAIDERRKQIDEGLKTAEAAKAALSTADAKVAEIMATARKEAADIVATAHKEATAMVEDADAKARKKADHIVAEAKASLDQEIAKARVALKKETNMLVAEATEAIIGQKLTSAADEKLIEQAITEASK